jgi:hypothetical protein
MNKALAVLLAMAMFVLVVDTLIMNVSISARARDRRGIKNKGSGRKLPMWRHVEEEGTPVG